MAPAVGGAAGAKFETKYLIYIVIFTNAPASCMAVLYGTCMAVVVGPFMTTWAVIVLRPVGPLLSDLLVRRRMIAEPWLVKSLEPCRERQVWPSLEGIGARHG